MNYIITKVENQIATITLTNDKKRNSLSNAMLLEIENAFDSFNHDDIRVVILRSNIDSKVWCAGLDISELPDSGNDPLPYNHPLERIMRKIENFKAPVIAMVTGSVWGGGTDLALTCDFIIGSPECSFAITPAKIGVPYNASGLLHFLNTVEMNIVKEMFFTAEPIYSEKAYNLGMINHLIEKEDIVDFTMNIATKITHNSPLSIGVIKEQLNLLGKARPMTPEVMERINQLRATAFKSYDFSEGKAAFLEKRKPDFKGE